MKTIFLDIDGVLNSDKFLSEQHITDFDPNAIQLLNHLVELTKAQVVLSSTRRKSKTLEQLNELFSNVGATFKISSTTPVFYSNMFDVPRGCEIKDFVFKNNITNYIILDDDTDFLIEQKDHLVQTDFKIGITQEDINKAISILENKSKHYL